MLPYRVEDVHDCRWSGGFVLDKDHSFHINMRWVRLAIVTVFRNRFSHSLGAIVCHFYYNDEITV